MLKIKITTFILFLTICAFAQEPSVKIDDLIHGIKQEGADFYEVSGYDVFKQILKAPITENNIKKFNKKFDFAKDYQPVYRQLEGAYLVFESDRSVDEESIQPGKYYYTYQDENGHGYVIGFVGFSTRDTSVEHYMVDAIRNDILPESIYSSQHVDSIKFAGRYIELGPACRWMNTHNIQCPNYGQMNWSEFRDSTRAAEMTAFQRSLNNQKFLGKEKENTSVKVDFEGDEVEALKTKVKIKVPELVMGGSNVLVVYYVTAHVRDRYVSCVLSHFTDDVNADGLPPLLQEVMELR